MNKRGVSQTWCLLAVLALGACRQQDQPAVSDAQPAPATQPAASQTNGVTKFAPETAEPAPGGGACALDGINGAPADGAALDPGSEALFSGWAVGSDGKPATNARIVLNGPPGRFSAAVSTGADRPDVAAALGSEDARMSGYNQATVLTDVLPGEYAVSIAIDSPTAVTCELNRTVTIVASP